MIQFGSKDSINELIERNRKNGWPDLEPHQRAFAYLFLVDFDHRAAAESVGMARTSGIRLLRHPMVAAFIEEEQQKQATNAFITKEYITTQYINMIPMLLGEVDMPFTNASGEQCYGKQFRPAELRGILQELSKTVDGFNKEKMQQGASGGVSINLNLANLIGEVEGVTIEGESKRE